MWNVLGQAATVAQLVGADVGGLISMIIQAAVTAQQNKKECEQLARRVFTIGELLQHLQDPEVLRRPEIQRPLAGLGDTLREAHELVMACQGKSAVYRLVLAGRQAERFRDVQSRIDSYLLLFPVISHIDITRRLERIYNILLPNDTAGPSAPAASMPQIAVQDSHQIDWKEEPHGVQEFTFKELAKATNNFAPDKMIGQGGFGRVYMGWFPDGRQVAIKRIDTSSSRQMEEFKTGVTILRSVRHKHIVRLFGYSLPQEKRQLLPKFWKKNEKQGKLRYSTLLVYEYTENRSLHFHLHGPTLSPVTSSWKMRIEILLGVSRAIEYVQTYAERPVIHRDVKSSNILLDASWAPRLADFGVALTWEGLDREDIIIGTYGYMAPEYLLQGTLNPTADVYSFGVVMLEVLTGKRAYFYEEWEEKREVREEEKREVLEEERDECEEEKQKGDEWKEKEERDECEEDDTIEEWDEVTERAKLPRVLAARPHRLAAFAAPLIEAGELCKVLDRRPAATPTPRQVEAAELVAQAAVRCLRLQSERRPSISQVVATLETALELARCDG